MRTSASKKPGVDGTNSPWEHCCFINLNGCGVDDRPQSKYTSRLCLDGVVVTDGVVVASPDAVVTTAERLAGQTPVVGGGVISGTGAGAGSDGFSSLMTNGNGGET